MIGYWSWKTFAGGGAVLAVLLWAVAAFSRQAAQAPAVMVYKSPACGCCTKWIEHLRANGFTVATEDVDDLTSIRSRNGVTPQLSACHTAIVDEYVVEGHVPADVIKRLLRERPRVVGITVPGMPLGSPGMEGRYSQPYNVLTFDSEGSTEIYARR